MIRLSRHSALMVIVLFIGACAPLRERPKVIDLKALCQAGQQAGPEAAASPGPGNRYQRAIASTVILRVVSKKSGCAPFEEWKGSGVIIDSRAGLILTAAHVVKGAAKIDVATLRRLDDGRIVEFDEFSAVVLSVDPPGDSAVLMVKRQHQLPPAMPMDCRWLPLPGQPIVHFGQTTKVSVGRITALRLFVTSDRRLVTSVETDAEAESGDSGGPVTVMNGRLVGLLVSKAVSYPRSYFVSLADIIGFHDGRKPIQP